jgi:hypothetical protein
MPCPACPAASCSSCCLTAASGAPVSFASTCAMVMSPSWPPLLRVDDGAVVIRVFHQYLFQIHICSFSAEAYSLPAMQKISHLIRLKEGSNAKEFKRDSEFKKCVSEAGKKASQKQHLQKYWPLLLVFISKLARAIALRLTSPHGFEGGTSTGDDGAKAIQE